MQDSTYYCTVIAQANVLAELLQRLVFLSTFQQSFYAEETVLEFVGAGLHGSEPGRGGTGEHRVSWVG